MANRESERQYQKWAILFTTPNVILFVLFFALPAILGIFYSFTNYNGFNRMDFIGFKNYVDLFHDGDFYKVALRTLSYVIIVVPFIYVMALMTAVLFTSTALKARALVRVLVYIPTLFSGSIRYPGRRIRLQPSSRRSLPQSGPLPVSICSYSSGE